jgi:hypothetical protein
MLSARALPLRLRHSNGTANRSASTICLGFCRELAPAQRQHAAWRETLRAKEEKPCQICLSSIYGIFFFGCLCGFALGISANSYYTPKPKPASSSSETSSRTIINPRRRGSRVSVDLRRRVWQRIGHKPHADAVRRMLCFQDLETRR